MVNSAIQRCCSKTNHRALAYSRARTSQSGRPSNAFRITKYQLALDSYCYTTYRLSDCSRAVDNLHTIPRTWLPSRSTPNCIFMVPTQSHIYFVQWMTDIDEHHKVFSSRQY